MSATEQQGKSPSGAGVRDETPVPVFVPFALPLDEALAVLGAARTIFMSGAAAGDLAGVAPLARAMVTVARATDTAQAGDPS